MVEIVWLAATAVGKFLVPFFTEGKDQLTEDLAEAEGKTAAEALVKTAGSIWARVKSHFDHEDEKNAVTLFEKSPKAMEPMLTELLGNRLEADAAFRQQIQELVEAPVADKGQASWELMGEYVGAVDARHSVITGSTVAGIIMSGGHVGPSPEQGAKP